MSAQAAITVTVKTNTSQPGSQNRPPSHIGDFLMNQGPPWQPDMPAFYWRDHNDPWIMKAWTDVGMAPGDVIIFDHTNTSEMEPDGIPWKGFIRVTRNGSGGLDLDFSIFDEYITSLKNNYQILRPDFQFWGTPWALTIDPNNPLGNAMAPANYTEWRDIVRRAVTHIKNDLGLPGTRYHVLAEISYFYDRNGQQHVDREIWWNEYLEWFYHTCEAIKEADPTAKVGFPMFTTCSRIYEDNWGTPPPNGGVWGPEYAIEAIKNYKDTHPGTLVDLDYLIWQDYNWTSWPDPGVIGEGSFAPEAAYIHDLLVQNGMPNCGQGLMGWSGVDGETTNPGKNAAHVTYNIIQQCAPGEAGYMSWACLYWMGVLYVNENMSWYIYQDGETWKKRASYAALQALHAMEGDASYIQTTESSNLKAMTTRRGSGNTARYTTILAHSQFFPINQPVVLKFANLPPSWLRVKCVVKRIDDTHSADGTGLEAGQTLRLRVAKRTVTLPQITMPTNSIVQVILTRAG